MTAEEKQKMMEEIMQVVDKHVAKSEKPSMTKEQLHEANRYGRQYGISDEEMATWKEEYRKMRVNTKEILEAVRNNPIDTSTLVSSFDLGVATSLLK